MVPVIIKGVDQNIAGEDEMIHIGLTSGTKRSLRIFNGHQIALHQNQFKKKKSRKVCWFKIGTNYEFSEHLHCSIFLAIKIVLLLN